MTSADIQVTDKFDLNVINEKFTQLDDRTKTEKRFSKMSIDGFYFSDVTWTILKEKDSTIVRAFAEIDIPEGAIIFDQAILHSYYRLSKNIRIYDIDFIATNIRNDYTIRMFGDDNGSNMYQRYICNHQVTEYIDDDEPWTKKLELTFNFATIYGGNSSVASACTIKIGMSGVVPS